MISKAKYAALIASALVCACAPVKIYNHEGEVVKGGLPVEIPQYKTFVMVQTDPQSPQKLATSLLTLPVRRCSDTYYLKPRGSWGASKMGFELQDGRLTAFNAEADGHGAATISALGDLLAGASGFVPAKSSPGKKITKEELEGVTGDTNSEKVRKLIVSLIDDGKNQATLSENDVPKEYRENGLSVDVVRRYLPPAPEIMVFELRMSDSDAMEFVSVPLGSSAKRAGEECVRRYAPKKRNRL